MLYAILCYNAEDVVMSWSQEEDDAVMAQLNVTHSRLEAEGKLGPSLRLMPTTAASSSTSGGRRLFGRPHRSPCPSRRTSALPTRFEMGGSCSGSCSCSPWQG